MSQSGFLAAALLAGFVFYLAAKGRLPVYWGLLIGEPAGGVPAGGSSGGGSATGATGSGGGATK